METGNKHRTPNAGRFQVSGFRPHPSCLRALEGRATASPNAGSRYPPAGLAVARPSSTGRGTRGGDQHPTAEDEEGREEETDTRHLPLDTVFPRPPTLAPFRGRATASPNAGSRYPPPGLAVARPSITGRGTRDEGREAGITTPNNQQPTAENEEGREEEADSRHRPLDTALPRPPTLAPFRGRATASPNAGSRYPPPGLAVARPSITRRGTRDGDQHPTAEDEEGREEEADTRHLPLDTALPRPPTLAPFRLRVGRNRKGG